MSVVNRQLISALVRRSAAAEDGPTEKRRAKRPRIWVGVDVQMLVDGQIGPWFRCEMRDISVHGVCLSVAEPIEPGSEFVIRLPRMKGYYKPPVLVCRAARCGHNSSGGFRIGAQFIDRLDDKSASAEPGETLEARIQRAMLS
jgi:hypothetical protein